MRKIMIAVAVMAALSGCTTTEQDVSVGTGAGALIGGAVGGWKGAAIGAAVGAAQAFWFATCGTVTASTVTRAQAGSTRPAATDHSDGRNDSKAGIAGLRFLQIPPGRDGIMTSAES